MTHTTDTLMSILFDSNDSESTRTVNENDAEPDQAAEPCSPADRIVRYFIMYAMKIHQPLTKFLAFSVISATVGCTSTQNWHQQKITGSSSKTCFALNTTGRQWHRWSLVFGPVILMVQFFIIALLPLMCIGEAFMSLFKDELNSMAKDCGPSSRSLEQLIRHSIDFERFP